MRRLTLVLVVVLALSCVALAQAFPRAEANLGYAYARVQTRAVNSFNAMNFSGVGAGATFNFSRAVGIVADFGTYKSTRSGTGYTLTSFMGGPQFTYHGDSRLSPFARFLVGAMHNPTGYINAGQPSGNTWAYGFGGGADVIINKHFSVRAAQVDYIRSHIFSHESNVRISMGVVFRFGEKTK